MKISKDEIADAKNLMFACECCGRQEGLKAFAEMAKLAGKLQEAIEAAEKEPKSNGHDHDHSQRIDDRRDSHRELGARQS